MMPLNSFVYAIPYVLIFFMLVILSLPYTNNNVKFNSMYKAYSMMLVFILLFMFFGFRGFIFTDWKAYYDCFMRSPVIGDSKLKKEFFFNADLYSSWEKGFLWLNVICKSIIPEWWFFQVANFIIDFFVVLLFIKFHIPKYVVLGMCFYFSFGALRYDVNLLRNAKAIMIFICSLKFVKEQKIMLYMALNLLGTLFHSSAIFFLPLYFVLNKKPSRMFLILLFVIGNILFLFKIRWLSGIIEFVLNVIGGRLSRVGIAYLNSDVYSSAYGLSVGYIERTITFFLVMHFRNRLLKTKSNVIVLNIMYIYLFSFLFLSEMSILSDRIPTLFLLAYWIVYPQIYGYLNKNKKMLFLVLFFLYSSLKIVSGYSSVVCAYDNIIFPQYSYHQRVLELKRFLRQSR